LTLAYWLVKTEPNEYSYADLEKLGQDRWNGVRNFVALRNLRKMFPGDLVFVYHTGKQKAIIGVAEVLAAAYPDPAGQDARHVVVDLAPRYRLKRPVTLKEIKAEPRFGGWELVRQSRLSVMPVDEVYWSLVQHLATT
jgi:predicted RNA-binding protein with PUA-like domain